MKGYFQNELGRVYIDPTIITRLCVLPELSLSDAFVPPRDGPVPDDPYAQVTRKGVERYIQVDFNDEGEVILSLNLLVRYGPPIRSSAARFQEKVIRHIEASTGLKVAKVDMKVDGIYRPSGPAQLPPAKEPKKIEMEQPVEAKS